MRTIRILQCGRGIAASVVVLHHAALSTELRVEALPQWLASVFHFGFLGVDFFFVLSGFIILHAHADDKQGPAAAIDYLEKRLTRIYVPYLPIGLMMAAYYASVGLSFNLLTSVTLIPAGAPALSVAWTLTHELVFYCVFAVSYFTRHFAVLISAWAVSTIAFGVLPGENCCNGYPAIVQESLRVFLSPLNLEFIFGMVAAVVVRRMPLQLWPLALLIGMVGTVAFLFSLSDANPLALTRAMFGLSIAFILVAAVWQEELGRIYTPAWLMALGDASYAIYLVHNPVVAFVARAVGGVGALSSWPISLVVCAALGIGGGIVYHVLVEKPAYSYFRQSRRKAQRG
jgi:peptidoglycan/LPS O-acetylase OafA/YrhL